VAVQPIVPGDVVRRIWELYKDQGAVLIGTAAILFTLQFVLFLLLGGAAGLAIVVLFWALATLYQGMVVELVQDVQNGRREHSVGQLLESVEPVLLQLIAVSLLFAIAVGIGFVLLIVPGLILLTIWCLVAPVTVLERPGVFRAFSRSQELVRGNGWPVFSVIALVYLAVIVVSIAAGIVAGSLGPIGRAVVDWIVTVAVAPIAALSASVLYFALVGRDAPVQAPS
jgi:hypothetical protein